MLLAAAGLCHDLGKWLERARMPLGDAAGLEHVLCPSRQGQGYSHKHVLWSYDAARETIAPYLQHAGLPNDKADAFARLCARHHAPQLLDSSIALVCPVEEFILQQADWCSSGVDRMPDDEGLSDRRDSTLLRPLFLDVRLDVQPPATDLRYSLCKLAGDTSADPKLAAAAGHGTRQTQAFADLWQGFKADLTHAASVL
jgi:hypothetical protein